MHANNVLIPTVVEKKGNREIGYDLYSRLMKDRIIFVQGGITDPSANVVCGQLLFLHNQSAKKPIDMYINSPGGVVTASFAILDTMRYVTPKIRTICIGQAASAAALLLACGDERYSLKHSRIMIHQPSGGSQGTAADIEIQAAEILRLKEILNGIMAEATGRTVEEIQRDTDRDRYLSAEEAIEYGLIDEVVDSAPTEDEDEDIYDTADEEAPTEEAGEAESEADDDEDEDSEDE